MARSKKVDAIQVISNEDESIREVNIYDLTRDAYLEFGSYINNWRQLPQIIDGLKISYRRLLYSALQYPAGKMIKSANLLGKMMECFPGDTEILDVNGNKITIDNIKAKLDNNEKVYTFSCSPDGTPKVTKILDVIDKGSVNDLVEVTLDNEESFRCTPDHKIMLRTGVWMKAKDLKEGSSLMPVYLKVKVCDESNSRRFVKTNQYDKYARDKWEAVYHLSSNHYDSLSHLDTLRGDDDYLVSHHSDMNSLNDYPTNIVKIGNKYHRGLHGSISLSDYNLSGKLSERNKLKWKNGEYNENNLIKSVRNSNINRATINKLKLNVDILPDESVVPEMSKNGMKTLYVFIELMNIAVKKGLDTLNSNSWNECMSEVNNPTKHSLSWAMRSKYRDLILSYGIDIELEYVPDVKVDRCPSQSSGILSKVLTVLRSLRLTGTNLTPDSFDKRFLDIYKKRIINYEYVATNLPELVSQSTFSKIGSKVIYKSNNKSIISSDPFGNHKVSKVTDIHIPEGINVYDLVVDDCDHNFTLGVGIQVHNCHP